MVIIDLPTHSRMCNRSWHFASWLCFIVIVQCLAQEHQSCQTPKGMAGRCVWVRECGYVLDLIRRDRIEYADTEYLENFRCGSRPDGSALVCCPKFVNDPVCGPMYVSDRIFGGNDTEIGEFPWMGLLRFQGRNRRISPNCGASLINKRYVLTAAHCFTSADKKRMEIHSVRFGEWNFMNHRGSKDCKYLSAYNETICRKDYGVARVTLHPDYHVTSGVHTNDIAVIELETEVEYNRFVKPICLPVADDMNQVPLDYGSAAQYTAAGWGATEESSGMTSDLLQVNLPAFDKERCKKVFQTTNGQSVGVPHICAGGVRNQDTCHGDSGGPLMQLDGLVWYLAGITSFGAPKCGKEGVPGVYTNLSHFMEWIERETYRGILV